LFFTGKIETLKKELIILNLGRTPYGLAWDLQKKIFSLRLTEKISDVLILTEHEHVYTIGKSGSDNHLLAAQKELLNGNVELYHIDRGGDITYHGPGQLVGYPILNLSDYYQDIHKYLRDLEEVIIRTLSAYDIKAMRDPEYTGVWVGDEKIAAIGIKVSRWITMHGFALNVSNDLRYFDRIIPCGIFHKGVTTMEKITGRNFSINDVAETISQNFLEVFGCTWNSKINEEYISYIKKISEEKIECI